MVGTCIADFLVNLKEMPNMLLGGKLIVITAVAPFTSVPERESTYFHIK
jgi:hypothetical protein